ncbi:IPT/TIG domain-containing protein [Candidatus Saccharibacteria bacterium]|nr:IPT/TIG domain-containing protein [Candidatus Saccharibacteria bacterium]
MWITSKFNKLLIRLPFVVAVVVVSGFSAQSLILNIISPSEVATALSIHSITADHGPTVGGNTVTITGDFGIPDIPLNIVQMVTGADHAITLDSEGRIFAWGSNWGGQLGNGVNFDSNVPVEVDMTGVLAGRDIVQIAAGNGSSFALDSEGRIFAWGSNWEGALGNGTNIISNNVPVEVDTSGVLAGRRIVQIATTWHYTLVLDSEGNIFAWGQNNNGQLGNNTNISSNVPVEVDMTGVLAGRDIVQIVAGGSHSLALDSEGRMFAWGSNSSGELGNGTFSFFGSNVPVEVDMTGVLAGRNIVQIAAGGNHSFALDSEGRIFAWGINWGGQLGNGVNFDSNVPVEVDMTGVLAGRNIVQVMAGVAHSLAIDNEGQVFSWGLNMEGSLGNGVNFDSNVPVEVDMTGVLAGRNIVQVMAGWHSSFAIDSEGNVFAWGDNSFGQFGNNTNMSSNVPVVITNFGQGLVNSLELSVTLGNLPCTDVRIINSNTITCIVPAHPAGTVDVVVNTLHGSTTLYQGYTYIDIPDVPNTGHYRVRN